MDAGYYAIIIARRPPEEEVGTWPHAFVAWDLSEIDSLGQLATTLRARFGTIYGLVNNAGIGNSGILATMPVAQIIQVMQMNVVAPIALTRYLLRPMMKASEGRVVNISSIVASTGYKGLSVYSASKAALIGFTRSLAREVGELHITVNAVAPGFVATQMTHGLDEKHRHQILRRSALQRMPQAEDIASAVTFLMSDGASNITGTVITVDAGNTA
jgi:3-oxoacyl-[acyl-carrier protein] reductase